MSRENVEVVRAMWAAYARGDAQASLGPYAEDTVWDDTRFRPDGAVHVGRDALVDLTRAWRDAWEHYDIEAEDVLDAGGDRVVAVLRETGQGKGGSVELTNRWGGSDDGAERQDRPHDGLSDAGGGPRSRGAAGVVDDVAGEPGCRRGGLRAGSGATLRRAPGSSSAM